MTKPNLIFVFILFFHFSRAQESTNPATASAFKCDLLLNGHYSSNTKVIGAKFIGFYTFPKFSDFSLGLNGAYYKVGITKNVSLPRKAKTQISYITLGANFRYQLHKELCFSAEISEILGKEEARETYSESNYSPAPGGGIIITTRTYEKHIKAKLRGFHFEQNLFYYPSKAKNLVLGIGVFEQVLKTIYYENNVGVNAYIGIQLN
jgi:hypothetical protein